MTVQPENDGYEFTFVGDLKEGDELRVHGVISKIEVGSMTNTVFFTWNPNNPNALKCRTWHQFHSVEVKKR